jgi:C_GCAxxG_C_C family probable redox protein
MNVMSDRFEGIIERSSQLACEYEMKYFGCSQTVAAGLMEAFGIVSPDLLRSVTCMAGGIARRGQVCGVLTGGLAVIGYLTGRDDLEMLPQYQRAMDYGNKLYQTFLEKFGTVSCSEIQRLKFGRSFDLLEPKEREALHKKMQETGEGCQSVARDGARMAAEVVVEIIKSGPPSARWLSRRI